MKRRGKGRKKAKSRKGDKGLKFRRAICRLRRLKSHHQVAAINSSSDAFIRQLCSRIKKARRASLPPKASFELRRSAKAIRKLINPRTKISKKRQILTQRGGGIIGTLLRNLGGFFTSLLP